MKDSCGDSEPFVIGHCQIGGAFWMAVAGTVRETETDRETGIRTERLTDGQRD